MRNVLKLFTASALLMCSLPIEADNSKEEGEKEEVIALEECGTELLYRSLINKNNDDDETSPNYNIKLKEIRYSNGRNGFSAMSGALSGDIDGDGRTEILALNKLNSNYYYVRNISVLDGETMQEKWSINTPILDIYGTKMTFADVDKDGKAEIFLLDRNHKLYSYDYRGNQRWEYPTPLDHFYNLTLADVNSDGDAELVIGHYIFNAKTGKLLLNGKMENTGTGFCSPHMFDLGGDFEDIDIAFHVTSLYDFDGDGQLEMCAGNTIYKMRIKNNTGEKRNKWEVLRQMPKNEAIHFYDGETIVSDFDNDGDADIVVFGLEQGGGFNDIRDVDFYVWDGQTDQLIAHTKLDNSRYGVSVPCCYDGNGDGFPEIAVNRDNGVTLLTYDDFFEGKVKSKSIHTRRFNETVSFSAFDFDEDGKDELVLSNFTELLILDGMTLQPKAEPITAYSGTVMEVPIIADVNDDGHAEIVVPSGYEYWRRPYNWGAYMTVYGSGNANAWPAASRTWNSYPYNPVFINRDLTVPSKPYDFERKDKNGKKPYNSLQKQIK